MKYRTLGRSGLEVSRICLGCMGFGGDTPGAQDWSIDAASARPVISRAIDLGINFFDTANAYSKGTSEEIVGKALGEMGNRDEIVVATKLYFPMRRGHNAQGLSRKAIMAELEHSLRRLGTDYIDLYQIHRWDGSTPIEETLAALHGAVTAGKIRYIGASSMWAWQFSKALYTSELHDWTKFISMQDHYNLLHREEEREMLPLCADQGVSTLPWSPLARGVLARPWGSTTARSGSDPALWKRLDPDHDRPIVDRLGEVADNRGSLRAQVALAWVLANPVVAAPIVGATDVRHLEDAVAAVDIVLDQEEMDLLEELYTPRDNVF